MFEHQQILDRIIEIEKILIHLGFEKKNDFPKNWNLDSTMKFTPKNDNFTVNYKNQNRVLMSIEVGIVSGLIFTAAKMFPWIFKTTEDLNHRASSSRRWKR